MPVLPYNLSPLLPLLCVGLLVAAGPLLWVAWRQRKAGPGERLHALALVTLFLTFDLVLFGAFTRLSDSGLGCPDWPGCYGQASPLGAHAQAQISAAQVDMPSGPVTHGKAWVEMLHRYLATAVGVLITVLAVGAWRGRGALPLPAPRAWLLSWLTLAWVCVQGAFGALTVTMKLFPAIVSLHLLGGYVLLALLTLQCVQGRPRQNPLAAPVVLAPGLAVLLAAALVLLVLQAASGAWVSTNYAVLACNTFPHCQGQWWPAMDFARAFELWRPLGESADGQILSVQALTAIHVAHRLMAMGTALVLATLAWRLHRHAALRTPARALAALLAAQLATGLSNVVLGWPLLAAILHTGGAGALVVLLVWLLATTRIRRAAPARSPHRSLQPGFSE